MRKVFLTLIPNRTVALILQGLCLPLTLFPLMLIFFYERYLFLWVNLSPTIPISFWIGLAFFAANAVLTIISRDKEILCGINPFSKAAFRPHAQAQEREEEVKSEDTSTLYRMQQASAAEQAERLRRLLGQEEDKE